MATTTAVKKNAHVKIVVEEGRVTMEDLHKALDLAVRQITKGGCNCGLTGFDISFLRGDPALNKVLTGVANIKGGIISGA
jgi:hypothetical protein